MEYTFSKRMSTIKASAIREILKATADPNMISFAGGNPAAQAFPVEALSKISAEILKNEKVDEKISAYKLDKIIWLNCTGNFYLNDTKIGRDMIVNGISNILK